ncbi:MAG: radical SAM protein [Bacteroidota bacterium]
MKNVTGTKEWAEDNENILNGCSHSCLYCYAHSMAQRFHRLINNEWNQERLKADPRQIKIRKTDGRIMYPSVHDITPPSIDEHVAFIHRLLDAGNKLLIVSKPHIECIKRICEEFEAYKDQITFRFTIGSIDNVVLSFWEPGAPKYEERLECLKIAYSKGFQTSVSLEPMLEGNPDALIASVSPFVTDTVWLGKANRLKSNLKLNGFTQPEILTRADALIESQNDKAIRKLYERYKDNPKIRFKESIKKVVGLELQTEAGMDI